MSAQPQHYLTPQEYLELDRASPVRNEYYKGRMYAMAGGSHRHSMITFSLGGELRLGLKGRSCFVSGTDTRVRVSEEFQCYPDVVVVCGETKYADGRSDTVLNPVLVIEVLSPSTESYDRGTKFAQYRRLETLQEFALVSQNEPHVEIYRRQPSGEWLLSEVTGMDSSCRFASVDCTVALAEIYHKVTFDESTAPANHPPIAPAAQS